MRHDYICMKLRWKKIFFLLNYFSSFFLMNEKANVKMVSPYE